jgi:hypothetical protein
MNNVSLLKEFLNTNFSQCTIVQKIAKKTKNRRGREDRAEDK